METIRFDWIKALHHHGITGRLLKCIGRVSTLVSCSRVQQGLKFVSRLNPVILVIISNILTTTDGQLIIQAVLIHVSPAGEILIIPGDLSDLIPIISLVKTISA